DRLFFPSYDAILLYRLDVPQRFPDTWKAFQALAGSISNEEMLFMNARAELLGESFELIAHRFLPSKSISQTHMTFLDQLLGPNLWPLIKQHLFLVFGSLIPAIIVGIILGIVATYSLSIRYIILNLVGVIQTIPSLALFAFLI